MALRNPDLNSMHRLLHRHQWGDIDDWVRALRALADLSDAEIDKLAQPRSRNVSATGRTAEDAGAGET